MSMLTSSSSASVSRGHDYYQRNKVKSVKQLSDYEYEGYVDGSQTSPYYVKIDINHPKKSYCDCPHVNGNTLCKHMVALYFTIFESEVADYEEWLYSDYNNDLYEEYDDEYHSYFEKPLFFDEVLENYVESLSIEELRTILKSEFYNNEQRAYDLYLKNNYKKYISEDTSSFEFLNNLKKRFRSLNEYRDYNYHDYTQQLLNTKEKTKIKTLYQNPVLKEQIDLILFVPELAVYNDYQNIAKFYKENKKPREIKQFCEKLENYFNSLKHYGIRNNTPKSNIAIVYYLLSNYSLKELAKTLIKNAKYDEYITYIIENHKNIMGLYKEFIKLIEKNYMRNKTYIPGVIREFLLVMEDEDRTYCDYSFYNFLCNEDIDSLKYLEKYVGKKKTI